MQFAFKLQLWVSVAHSSISVKNKDDQLNIHDDWDRARGLSNNFNSFIFWEWTILPHSQKSANSTNVREDKQRLLGLTLTSARISFITILTWTLGGTSSYLTCVTFVWKYHLLYQNSVVRLSTKIKWFFIKGVYFSLFIEPNLLLDWIWLGSPFLQFTTVHVIVCHIFNWFCKRKKSVGVHFTPGLEENTTKITNPFFKFKLLSYAHKPLCGF